MLTRRRAPDRGAGLREGLLEGIDGSSGIGERVLDPRVLAQVDPHERDLLHDRRDRSIGLRVGGVMPIGRQSNGAIVGRILPATVSATSR